MKTFAVFFLILLVSMAITFNTYKGATIEEMLKFIIATQLAYILYKLAKEENKY
jgi:hypothetical protein